MKKAKFFLMLFLFPLLLLSGIFILGEDNSFNPETITPQKMYASGKLFDFYYIPYANGTGGVYNWLPYGGDTDSSQAQIIGHVNISLEFWNVGSKGNGIFDKSAYGLTSADYYGFGTVKIKTTYEGEPTGGPGEVNNFEWLGQFSGGPGGVIEPDWYSSDLYVDKWPIVNTNVILIGFKGNPAPSPVDIAIKNSEAFYNSANPPETTEATEDTSVSTETETIVADEKLEAPTIKLILKGPFEVGGNQNSFIIEAIVSGNPEPSVTFSRDDSGGNMGEHKALINMAPDSEITVLANAKNKAGEANSQINISTKAQPPSLKLKVIEGPVWLNIESAYYVVEAEVKGFPVPYVVWENPSRTEFYPAGKNKKYVYVREGDFQNVTISAYASNSKDKSEKQSITLSWADPPANLFAERTQTIFKNSAMNGNLLIKRAGEHNWVAVNTTLTLYEGDSIRTDASGAIAITSDLKGWIILGTNSNFIVSKDENGKNIIIRQGSARFNIGKSENNNQNVLTVKSKYGNAKITGTDFIIISDDDKSILKVISGKIDFTSTVTDDIITVNSGESVVATEKGLEDKTTFDIQAEEKYWDDFKTGFDTDGVTSNRDFMSNLQYQLDNGKIPGILIFLIIFDFVLIIGAILIGLFVLKRYRII